MRQDPYAEANRIQVEQMKPKKARGLYLHPELYGRTAEFRESTKLTPETLRQRQAASQSAEQKIGSQIERRED